MQEKNHGFSVSVVRRMSGHKKGVSARDGENYAIRRFAIRNRNTWKKILIENVKAQ